MRSIKELAKDIDFITADNNLDLAKEKINEMKRILEQEGKLKKYLGKRLTQQQIDKIIEDSKHADIKQLEVIKNQLKEVVENETYRKITT